MKVYARQINPEYQDSSIYMEDDYFMNHITVYGNRDYREHLQPVFERVRDALDNGDLAYELENIKRSDYYKNATEAINDLLAPEKEKYSTRDIHTLKNLIADYAVCRSSDEDDILCAVLAIVTGHEWTCRCIRGCCPSDWNYAYYQTEDFPEGIDEFEALYFNTGSEWIIHDEDSEPEDAEDISGWSMYCFGWSDEKVKGEIAAATGAAPEGVTLYKWAGYSRFETYEVA